MQIQTYLQCLKAICVIHLVKINPWDGINQRALNFKSTKD